MDDEKNNILRYKCVVADGGEMASMCKVTFTTTNIDDIVKRVSGSVDNHRPQEELLLEKVKRKNIIVYLATGSGKTFIAVMLIKPPHPQGRHPV